jgi:hypothetical protein
VHMPICVRRAHCIACRRPRAASRIGVTSSTAASCCVRSAGGPGRLQFDGERARGGSARSMQTTAYPDDACRAVGCSLQHAYVLLLLLQGMDACMQLWRSRCCSRSRQAEEGLCLCCALRHCACRRPACMDFGLEGKREAQPGSLSW